MVLEQHSFLSVLMCEVKLQQHLEYRCQVILQHCQMIWHSLLTISFFFFNSFSLWMAYKRIHDRGRGIYLGLSQCLTIEGSKLQLKLFSEVWRGLQLFWRVRFESVVCLPPTHTHAHTHTEESESMFHTLDPLEWSEHNLIKKIFCWHQQIYENQNFSSKTSFAWMLGRQDTQFFFARLWCHVHEHSLWFKFAAPGSTFASTEKCTIRHQFGSSSSRCSIPSKHRWVWKKKWILRQNILTQHVRTDSLWGEIARRFCRDITFFADIRDTVKYKEVMKQYQLGPNGGIITSLNLFATRFDQVKTSAVTRWVLQQ